MYNYCTLFDSNYLTRGLAMYESLKKYSDNFYLYIFAFDNRSCNLLKNLNLEFVTIVSLAELEDDELLKVKKDRTAGEYCWTCTPSVIRYSIEKYNLDSCTYLDADLFFFGNPSELIEEMGDKSVLITEHRYTKKYDQSDKSGIYCVQFITFKNDEIGMMVLNWWRDACNKWCYARFENGKFGDQKYLDDWPVRFEGIHVLIHPGGGVAPWNIQKYNLSKKEFKLIFFHFHNFRFLANGKVELTHYKLSNYDLEHLYKPYLIQLEIIKDYVEKIDNGFDFHGSKYHRKNLILFLKHLKRRLMGNYYIFNKKEFIEKKWHM